MSERRGVANAAAGTARDGGAQGGPAPSPPPPVIGPAHRRLDDEAPSAGPLA